jgi:hypothetical protein
MLPPTAASGSFLKQTDSAAMQTSMPSLMLLLTTVTIATTASAVKDWRSSAHDLKIVCFLLL